MLYIYSTPSKYSTRNVNLHISILSYRACILSYRAFILSYRACILSGCPFILSWKQFIRFCVYRVQVLRLSGFPFNVRIEIPRHFLWINTRKIQRSPIFCYMYYCWIIEYCGFLFAVTICICFLKQKVYQYYFKFNLINRLLTGLFFYLDCTYADRAKCTFSILSIWIDVLTTSPQSKYLPV